MSQFRQLVKDWLNRSNHSHKPQSMDEVMLSTAESHLAHQAKLDALNELVMTDDLEQLAFDDREAVRQYKQKTQGLKLTPEQGITRRRGSSKRKGKVAAPDDMGHILGDVHVEQSPRSTLANLLIPLAALALAGWVLWNQIQPDDTEPVKPGPDRVTDVQVGFGTPQYKEP